jgi:hypothetical protein
MSADKIGEIERRLSLIEAFLDTELRERQNFSRERDGPLGNPWHNWNPWSGCADGTRIAPVGISPIVSRSTLQPGETALDNAAERRRINKTDAVENAKLESGDT